MAQLGDLARARVLVRSAARVFGSTETVARARCVVAEAEIALAARDLRWPAKTLDELQSQLRRAIDGRPADLKAVFLKAPRTVNYGEVAKVIDLMKFAGCAPIGLQIENLDQ